MTDEQKAKIIKNRRYREYPKRGRKDWVCFDCGNAITTDEPHEWSWMADMKAGIRLCNKCREKHK